MASLVGDTTTITAELVEIVEHPGAVDAVEERLRAAGLDVRRDLNQLRVTAADQQTSLDAIRDAVAAEQARLRRVVVDRTTLEDLFTEAPA